MNTAALARLAARVAYAVAAVAFCVVPWKLALATQRPLASSAPAVWVYNLDYSNGWVETYRVVNGMSKLEHRWNTGTNGDLGGLAVDRYGLAYVGVDSSIGRPCIACILVFEPDGTLLARINAPTLPGASNPPDITDVAVDDAGDVFASDMGQKAVYEFLPTPYGFAPQIVVENSDNDASVAVTSSARQAFISGGCGFAAVRLYLISDSGGYVAQNCFNIGTIALIGGAVDEHGAVFTPVDGAAGLVSISDANGRGYDFRVPGHLPEIGSVALSRDEKLLYVSDARHEQIFVFARATGGWLSKTGPQLVMKYRGFKHLDVIAVSP